MGNILFQGAVTSGVTKYVAVPIRSGQIGVSIGWTDATSAATITLELASADEAPLDTAGAAYEWKGSGLTITGPVGAAAGVEQLNVENVRQRKAKLKIVATANCNFDIRDGGTG